MALIRPVDPATLTALSGAAFHPAMLAFIDWPGAPTRAHNGVGTLTWQGAAFHGVGKFGSVELPAQGFGIASDPAILSLVGVPDEMDAYLLDPPRGFTVQVWLGCFTERGGRVLVGDPFEVFRGKADAVSETTEITQDDGGIRIVRTVRLVATPRPSQRATDRVNHSPEDQARRWPGDTAGRHLIGAEARSVQRTWPE